MGFFGPPPGSNIKRPGDKGERQRNVGKGGRGGLRQQKEARERRQAEEPEESPRTHQANICERDASRAVLHRESLLLQLNAVVLHWPGETVSRRESRQTTDAVRILANLSKQIGEAGLKAIEKIVAWVLVVSDSSGPKPFLWNGSDYLLKMFTDLDFVTTQLGAKAWKMGNFCAGNPLLLSAEEMAGRGPKGKAHASRVRAASMVLLDVLNRNGGVPQTSHLEVSINGPTNQMKPDSRQGRSNTSPRMNSRQQNREVEKDTKQKKVVRVKPPVKPVTRRTEAERVEEVRKRQAAKKAEEEKKRQEAEDAIEQKKKDAVRKLERQRKKDTAKKIEELRLRDEGRKEVDDKVKSTPPRPEAKSDDTTPTHIDQIMKTSASVRESKDDTDNADDGKSVKSVASVRESKDDTDNADDGKSVKSVASVRESKDDTDDADDGKSVKSVASVRESKDDTNNADDGKSVKSVASVRESKDDTDNANDGKSVNSVASVRESKDDTDNADDGKSVKSVASVRESKDDTDNADDGKSVKSVASVRESKDDTDIADDGKSVKSVASVRESKDDTDNADDGKSVNSVASVRESKDQFGSGRVTEDNVLQQSRNYENESIAPTVEEVDVNDKGPEEDDEEDDEYEEDYDDEYEEEYEEEMADAVEANEETRASNEWKVLRVLGEGNYGTVSEVERKGVRAAMKLFKQDDEDDEETAEYARKTQVRECELAKLLVHENVAKLLDSAESPLPYLVFELMPMNLLDFIQQQSAISPEIVKEMSRQLCAGLTYCHHMSVVHRDLKPENVLVKGFDQQDGVLKLCDFGAARRLDVYTAANRNQLEELDDMTNYVGSRWYRAPESLANRTAYRFEIDIWGAACIIAEIATGESLFSGDDENEVLASIISLIGAPPRAEAESLTENEMPPPIVSKRRSFESPVDHSRGLGGQGIALLTSMLQWEPKRRTQMKDCLKHAYFSSDIPPPSPITSFPSSNPTPTELDEDSVESLEENAEDSMSIGESKIEEAKEEPGKQFSLDGHIEDHFLNSLHAGKLLIRVVNGDIDCLSSFIGLLEEKKSGSMILTWLSSLSRECSHHNQLIATLKSPLTKLAKIINRALDSKLQRSIDWCENWMSSHHRSDAGVMKLLSDAFKSSSDTADTPRTTKSNEACIENCAHILEFLHKSLSVEWKAVENVCLNRLIGLLTNSLLDEECSSKEKLTFLHSLESSLFGMQLISYGCLLSAGSRSVLLHTQVLDSTAQPQRLIITTDREHALNTVMNLFRDTFPNQQYSNKPNQAPRIVLDAFYKSEYGKKVSEGFAVEEGEGMGPRKELFSLMSAQLQEEWSLCGEAYVSFERDMSTVHIASSVVEGHSLAPHEVESKLLGHRLLIQSESEELRVVMSSGPKSSSPSLRLDRPMPSHGNHVKALVHKKNCPVFTYRQSGECAWLNSKLIKGPRTEEQVFFAGLILGLTIVNNCVLNIPLPVVFFRALLDSRWYPQLEDLLELDPSFQTTISNVKHMSQSSFLELLEVEFGSSTPSHFKSDSLQDQKDAYITSLVAEFFEPCVSWQMKAIREGFRTALPTQALDYSASDLRRVVCGEVDNVDTDFDFKQVFRIKMDPDFAKCEVLRDTFWEVVDHLPVERKRQLLQFITGVNQLPSIGSQLLSIDIPFYPMGLDDHYKVLGMIPQSHTCDNVFELPNYWTSLVKTNSGLSDDALRTKLKSLLAEKLSVACDNAAGYGLDALVNDNDSTASSPRPIKEKEVEVEEESMESSGHFSIPGIDDEPEQVDTPVKEVVVEEVPKKSPEASAVDDYEEDDYEDEFDFEEDSVEL